MQLADRRPHLDAHDLVPRFVPPHRFEDARFGTYVPDARFPSQSAACSDLQQFADGTHAERQSRTSVLHRALARSFRRRSADDSRPARYLDGGYGVGKTHLLASLWHAASGPKAYLTFADLTAFVGFAGMQGAIDAFRDHQLLCIDEFELDDVANTLMVVSFLRGTMIGGMRLAVTSNTLPDRLGEQRFSADDFRREIAAIAGYFDELRIDGADFRTSHAPLPLRSHRRDDGGTTAEDDFEVLLAHLRSVHPVQYGALLDGVGEVRVHGVRTIEDQDAALLFVQFIDKLYDARVPVQLVGCSPEEVFHEGYRHGGYRKKYGRAKSRMVAMEAESR